MTPDEINIKGSVRLPRSHEPDLEVVALKSLVSDYALRAKQAEELCNTLLNEKIPQQALVQLVSAMITQHSEHRASERAVHQQAILQSVLMLLDQGSDKSEVELRNAVNKVCKQITLALGPMYNQPSSQNTKEF